MERLAGAAELLDGPLDGATLAGNLRDLERANRWLGGAELSWRAVDAFVKRPGGPRRFSLLDIGTGAADIPVHLLRRADASSIQLSICATDVRTEVVERAHQAAKVVSGLEVALAAADKLEFRTDSYDVVHCSMVMHHLEPDDARAALAEMRRVARRAVIVNDLDRRRRWWLAAWLLSRAATANRYTRHDAPLSVARAYRPNEISALAAQVGLREVVRLWARPAYRYAVVLLA